MDSITVIERYTGDRAARGWRYQQRDWHLEWNVAFFSVEIAKDAWDNYAGESTTWTIVTPEMLFAGDVAGIRWVGAHYNEIGETITHFRIRELTMINDMPPQSRTYAVGQKYTGLQGAIISPEEVFEIVAIRGRGSDVKIEIKCSWARGVIDRETLATCTLVEDVRE